jgi:hypothetical protein
MSLGAAAIIQAAIDHLLTTGLFESVQGHESLSAPANGLAADVWLGPVRPAPANSGLAETSAILTLMARIYINANTQPADVIETSIADAVDTLMTAYSGDFTYGGLIAYVDLLGANGTQLFADPGYVTIGGVFYRCMTITIPCVIDDAWAQAS